MSGLIAFIIGFASLIIAFIGEGGHINGLLKWTAAMIVFGGTIGATMLAYPIEDMKRVGKILKVAFTTKQKDLSQLILYFNDIAAKTRKNGLLSLESEIIADDNIDPFIKKGLQLIVDGIDPQEVRDILELEADAISKRHKSGSAIFASAGGTAPTMGIIGTVLGLINVLARLAETDSAQLGESISSAFTATLYGLASANLIFLPIATKLKNLDKQDQLEKDLIIEAIILIQGGVSPNTLTEKLKGFLDKHIQDEVESQNKKVEA
jgi:chemotaxis protein MotA